MSKRRSIIKRQEKNQLKSKFIIKRGYYEFIEMPNVAVLTEKTSMGLSTVQHYKYNQKHSL